MREIRELNEKSRQKSSWKSEVAETQTSTLAQCLRVAAGHTHAHNSQTGSRNEETSKDRVKWRERRQSREDATPHTNETEDNLPAIERGFEIFADNNSTIHWFYRETRHNWSFSEPNSIRLIFIHTHTYTRNYDTLPSFMQCRWSVIVEERSNGFAIMNNPLPLLLWCWSYSTTLR